MPASCTARLRHRLDADGRLSADDGMETSARAMLDELQLLTTAFATVRPAAGAR